MTEAFTTCTLGVAAVGLASLLARDTPDSTLAKGVAKDGKHGSKEPLGNVVLCISLISCLALHSTVEGESSLPVVLYFFALAAVTYYVALVYAPYTIMAVVNQKMKKKFNHHEVNEFYHCKALSNASDRHIVKPCPDLLYSMAHLDFASKLGARAIVVSLANPGSYASLSFFSDSTDNFFVSNFGTTDACGAVKTVAVFAPSETSIDMAKAKRLLGVDEVVRCPSVKAAVLQRIFCPSGKLTPELIKYQLQATCTPTQDLPSGIESVALERSNSPWLTTPGSGFALVSFVFVVAGYLLSDWQGLLSAWRIAVALAMGLLALPVSLGALFSPWIHPYLPTAMQSVDMGCWSYNPKTGGTSADSFVRAAIALGGLLALNKSEAIYMMGTRDSDGNELDCRNDYIITCPKSMPGAWWSLTAYGGDHFLIPNEADTYSFSHQSAKPNADGTITIYWSSKKPNRREVLNWLPAGDSRKDCRAQLILRLYKPHSALKDATVADQEELSARFQLPIVKRVH